MKKKDYLRCYDIYIRLVLQGKMQNENKCIVLLFVVLLVLAF